MAFSRAWESRDPGALYLPFNDPFLFAYKDDPRFGAFARKAGLLAPAQALP